MGFWRRVAGWLGAAAVPHRFSETPPRPIDQVILEMSGRGAAPRVSRVEALSVPAVQRGRNMICAIATLPLVQTGPGRKVVRNALLEQIDPDVANVVTLAQTVEDLLFDAVSWWRITGFGFDGFPMTARHVDVGSVSLDPPPGASLAPLPSGLDPHEAVVWVDAKVVPASEMIRFDSPNPATLRVGGRAIRRAILLDKAAAMYSDDPRPLDYFSPAEGADEIEDDEVAVILAKWKASRKKRSTAWVPRSMKYNTVDSPSPADLQLAELQKQAGLDIANALGIDPEDLGISTTSRTYANAVDRRIDRINDVLAPFMRAITDRLSMGDVTKRGYVVTFDLDDYMKSNPTERWGTYKIAKEIGVMDPEEIREKEGLSVGAPKPEPAPAVPPADAAPVPQPAEVDASRDRVACRRCGDPDGVDAPNTLCPTCATIERTPSVTGAHPAAVAATFSDEPELRTFDLPMRSFSVNKGARTIEGLALPYGVTGQKYGLKFRFLKGALRWNKSAVSRVKMLRDHDMRQPLGTAVKLSDGPTGFFAKFRVASGPDGDRALALAAEGVLDGLSVGVDFDLDGDIEMDPNDESVMLVRRADLREVSLTAMPVFDDARVTSVAASRTGGENTMEDCATCGQQHAPGVACAPATDPPAPSGLSLTNEQAAMLLARPGALQALMTPATPATPAPPAGALTLSAEQLDTLIQSGAIGTLLGVPRLTPAAAQQPAPEQRQTVDPTRRTTATASVDEPMPYRFDRDGNLTKGATYDFSTDLFHGSKGNGEALARATEFMRTQFARMYAQFDVDKADAAALNPNIQRPDLYVDQKDFTYPIWDAINKGTIADSTPFVLPKFNTATGLVAAHVEGVEPTPGTFTATAQTITPSAVSGKVEITREAWDQGGNPQLSGLIWRQMTKAWFEALEASAVALLDGLTPTGITLTTAAVDDVLVGELKAAFAALQFVRGGLRMRDLFLQIDLYQALVDAKDADGRSLLPLLGPINSDGTVSEMFADLNIGGLRGRPAWALAASGTVAASSYLFDRNDVSGWSTAPQRLEFEYRTAYVDVAIWGYKALANTDLTGVREIIYDPA